MDGLCATGDAPEQYLCDKEWHRWWPRAGVQSTKWHAITGPDGPRLSVLFLLLNRWWINSQKGRGVKKQRETLWGRRAERQQPTYNVGKVKKKKMWKISGSVKRQHDKHIDQANFPSAHFLCFTLKEIPPVASFNGHQCLIFRVKSQKWCLILNYLNKSKGNMTNSISTKQEEVELKGWEKWRLSNHSPVCFIFYFISSF